jgi:hypothetical protein
MKKISLITSVFLLSFIVGWKCTFAITGSYIDPNTLKPATGTTGDIKKACIEADTAKKQSQARTAQIGADIVNKKNSSKQKDGYINDMAKELQNLSKADNISSKPPCPEVLKQEGREDAGGGSMRY